MFLHFCSYENHKEIRIVIPGCFHCVWSKIGKIFGVKWLEKLINDFQCTVNILWKLVKIWKSFRIRLKCLINSEISSKKIKNSHKRQVMCCHEYFWITFYLWCSFFWYFKFSHPKDVNFSPLQEFFLRIGVKIYFRDVPCNN